MKQPDEYFQTHQLLFEHECGFISSYYLRGSSMNSLMNISKPISSYLNTNVALDPYIRPTRVWYISLTSEKGT